MAAPINIASTTASAVYAKTHVKSPGASCRAGCGAGSCQAALPIFGAFSFPPVICSIS